VSAAAAIDLERRRALYRRALALGVAERQCRRADARPGPRVLRLLAFAGVRLPEVTLYAELLHADAGAQAVVYQLAPALLGVTAGAMELADRGLQAHAREFGYRVDVWLERAVDGAGDELLMRSPRMEALMEEVGDVCVDGCWDDLPEDGWFAPRPPLVVDQAQLATVALARAMAASVSDPVRVPGEIAEAIAHLLAIYLVALEVFSAG
jgi:hypothetical protein